MPEERPPDEGQRLLERAQAVTRRLSPRLAWGVAMIAGGLFVVLSLYRAFQVGWLHFHGAGPLALENPVIAGIMLLKQGANLYSPSVYADVPFYIQMYPPAYYYLVAALPEWPGNPYLVGRLVSGAFMMGSALTVLLVSRRRDLIPFAILLIAFFLSVYPVANNTLLARQDPMALFFAGASIVMLLRSGRTRWMVMVSAAFAVVALTSKQSYVAAPVAAMTFLALTDRSALRVYVIAFATLSLGFVVGAHLTWGSGFWWSTVGTLPADFRPEFYRWHTRRMAEQATYLVFAGLVATLFIRGLLDAGGRPKKAWLGDLPHLYLILAGVVCLLTLPKDGASLNYFFEPTLAGLLFCQDRLSRIGARQLHYRWAPAIAIAFLLALGADVVRKPIPPAFTRAATEERARHHIEVLKADLESLPGVERGALPDAIFVHPTLRNNLPNLGGMPILADDYLYSILIRDGRLESGIFVDAVANQRFDVVVLPLEDPARNMPGLGEEFFAALDAHYVEELEGLYRYLMPRPQAATDR